MGATLADMKVEWLRKYGNCRSLEDVIKASDNGHILDPVKQTKRTEDFLTKYSRQTTCRGNDNG